MKLYVVRHGQTNYNIANKVCGKSDVELTDLGKQQAKKASEQLQDVSLDFIFASPLTTEDVLPVFFSASSTLFL